MSKADTFVMMAKYNQRMNQQLLNVCKQLSDEQLHQDLNSFFPSIMAHWNHILFGDLIMLQRFVANTVVNVQQQTLDQLPTAKSVVDTFVTNLPELITLRALVDEIYIAITNELTEATCGDSFTYTNTEGKTLTKNVAECFQHVFNHQTHHRGQMTCLLSQLNLDFGCTDLPIIVPEGLNR